MRNNSYITDALERLGLSRDEVLIYLSLLKGQKNHLAVSRDTGIARSNVYRLIDGLIEKGIVHEVTTQNDKLLESTNPNSLEILVTEQEITAQQKREVFKELLPTLTGFINQDETFAIKNYNGISGLKQMLWNELTTKGEICIFSCGNLNKATGKNFAEKYRLEIINRGIVQRALENSESDNPTFSENPQYNKHYNVRFISTRVLKILPEITIHDDTVSVYNNFTNNTQLGTEIKNPFLVTFMKQIFEHYWKLAGPIAKKSK